MRRFGNFIFLKTYSDSKFVQFKICSNLNFMFKFKNYVQTRICSNSNLFKLEFVQILIYLNSNLFKLNFVQI
jgi:hypothetical protein